MRIPSRVWSAWAGERRIEHRERAAMMASPGPERLATEAELDAAAWAADVAWRAWEGELSSADARAALGERR
jgi:hypothetical protein